MNAERFATADGGGSRIRLRRMDVGDIPLGMRLRETAGWNQTKADWRTFLALRPEGCFVAEYDGVPVGTVTTVDYDSGFSWVGMVLVDPARRRRGIGTLLLQQALRSLESCETVKLDATAQGRLVYEQLGFRAEYDLSRQIRPHGAVLRRYEVTSSRQLSSMVDIASLAAYDAAAFGKPRRGVLEAWYQRAPAYAFTVLEGDALRGFCLGRDGSNCEHIGPVVADDIETAKLLVRAVLNAVGGRAVLIDTPLHDTRWVEFLAAHDFREERTFTRMYRGPNRFPGQPPHQWAISGPELG